MLVEAVASKLIGQFLETLGRAFLQDSNNIANLVTGSFQGYAAAVSVLPQRMVDLRAMRGAEFCEVIRRMVEERRVAREAVLPWHAVNDRRQAELEREVRVLIERVTRPSDGES
jgi:hypothetical protein